MERLSCTSTVSYNATEAAIHMARYQLAAPYCKGKRVLDVACGEGYGSYVLRQLGAAAVDGVDNSRSAITNAEALFARRGVKFHVHDAEAVDELFPQTRFDVIVCLETIEHLQNPKRFLHAIKKVAAEDAVIIMTCPNDHWYYANEDQSNPFHVRKYSFEAFRELTTEVLGNASAWGYGSPVVGFGAVADELVAGKDPLLGQTAMLDFHQQASAIMLPPRGFSNIGPRNCSYFVGVWGGDTARIYTSAVVPISMDHYANLVSWETARLSPRRISDLESERSVLHSDKLQLELQVGRTQTEFAALQSKSETLGRELEQARKEHDVTLDAVIKEHAVTLDAVIKEREHYRIQSFALAKELDLISAQVCKVSSERDRHLAAQEVARQLHELEVARQFHELEAVRQLATNLTAEVQQLHARLHAQDGLRFLTKATLNAARRRVVSTIRLSAIKVARLVKPYLPAPALSLAQKIARALRL